MNPCSSNTYCSRVNSIYHFCLFSHQWMDIWVVSFFIVIMNATMNVHDQVFVWTCFQFSWDIQLSGNSNHRRLPLCLCWYTWWYPTSLWGICLSLFFNWIISIDLSSGSPNLSSACSNLLSSPCVEFFCFSYCNLSAPKLLVVSFYNFYLIPDIFIWWDIVPRLSFSSLDMISFGSLNIFKVAYSIPFRINPKSCLLQKFLLFCMWAILCFCMSYNTILKTGYFK